MLLLALSRGLYDVCICLTRVLIGFSTNLLNRLYYFIIYQIVY